MNKVLRSVGGRVINKQIQKHTNRGGIFDTRFGLSLFRDNRISLGSKALALAVGGGLTAVLISAEVPLESLFAIALPFFGLLGDSVVDGLEIVMGPVVIGAMLLPHLANKPMVAQIRDERDGILTLPE